MKIVIVGAGEIGRHLAFSLSRVAHSIVVIETDETLAADLNKQLDARVLTGNGASVNTLVEAGVPECDLLLALTSDNNTNLVSSSMAKQLGAAKVICRVHPELQREEWLFDHRGHFKIDYIFSPERLAAVEFAKFIRNPDSLLVEEIARGRVELQQILLTEKSSAAGKTLLELKLPERIRIGSISRGGETFIPGADSKLQADDVLTLFGEPNRLREVVDGLQTDVEKAKQLSVVIFGGGEYGFSLAQMLEGWNCRVRIFETDEKICEELNHRLTRTTVINADATSLAELREENVGECDFFVASSQSDEDNVMTCLQAHNIGAGNCLTLIHRADYADAISSSGAHFGIFAAISPREATRRDLMRFVTSDKYHVVKILEAGEVVEATVPAKSKIVDKKIKDIEWPEQSGLVALLHGIHAAVPVAEDVIKAGDSLYALVSPKVKKKFLKLLGR